MQRRIADGQPADRSRGRQVILQQRGRDREHARHVVEAFLIGFVRREQRASIDLEAKQIADGVGVLAAVQAVNRHAACVRVGRSGRIELSFQRPRDRAIRFGIRPRPARRRHLAGSKLRDDLFPLLRVVGNSGRIQAIELQPGGLQPAVVAGDAVLVEDVARRDYGCGRTHGRRGGLRGHVRADRRFGQRADTRVRPCNADAGERQHRRQCVRTCRLFWHVGLPGSVCPMLAAAAPPKNLPRRHSERRA